MNLEMHSSHLFSFVQKLYLLPCLVISIGIKQSYKEQRELTPPWWSHHIHLEPPGVVSYWNHMGAHSSVSMCLSQVQLMQRVGSRRESTWKLKPNTCAYCQVIRCGNPWRKLLKENHKFREWQMAICVANSTCIKII